MRKLIIACGFLITFQTAFECLAQSGIIKGKIRDATSGQSLIFANVQIENSNMGAITDTNGNFILTNLSPGVYNVVAVYLGYADMKIPEVIVTNNNPVVLEINMQPTSKQLNEIVVTPSPFKKTAESPVSVRTLGISEIERNPGANRDISKVLQSLPGVAQGVAFRNDLIIRGGGPGENRFFLEDVETPNINHFATQGASGGPVGMLDVNYIKSVDFMSGAFPAGTGNALSSVLKVNYKEPRDDRIGFRLTLGASDFGAAVEGPVNSKSGFFISYRRSYLQFLFKLLELPFLPIYNDLQYKFKYKINDKNEFYTIFLGAYDNFDLNLDANETQDQQYILSFIPENSQWSYTNGYVFKHYNRKGYSTFVFSRNMLNNEAYKYRDNIEEPDRLTLNYESQEQENKFRIETTQFLNWLRLNAGVNYEFAKYYNSTFNKIATSAGQVTLLYESDLNLHKWGAWIQGSKSFFEDKLELSFGIRGDANNYSSRMNNLLNHISPRFSASYQISPQLSVNFNIGKYYQLPPYTVLGYRDSTGELTNKQTLNYLSAVHYVAGIGYNTGFNSRITVEGFYKDYANYPFSLIDSISMANFGSDFGVVGNFPADSRSNGRAYGAEFLYQQKIYKGYYGIFAYTYVRSEFTDYKGNYVPSSWDSRHIISVTGGKKFKRNWEVGAKFRFSTGTPYTPLNVAASSKIENYNVNPTGILDYTRLNEERIETFHSLDIRVDKKFFFKKLSFNIYLDIQNVYNFITNEPYILISEKGGDGNPVVDPNQPDSYITYLDNNPTGNVLPTIGFILEY